MPCSKLEDYDVLQTIGSGSYGTCRKVRRRTDDKVFVWKELDYGTMTEAEKQLLVSEVNLLRELKHPHIVRYHDRIIDRGKTTIYLVMEYCEGGDLGKLISKCKKERKYLDIDFIWKIFSQVVSALQECHKRDHGKHVILHRDLKPANIFLDANQNVKLGDFGLARVLAHDTSFAKTFVGTPYYMSPELMNNLGYNDKSDVWSLGCLMFETCSLVPPFLAPNQKLLAVKIKSGECPPIPSHFPEDLNHLIHTMLRVNKELRPSISELAENPLLTKKNKARNHEIYHSPELKQKEESLKQKEKALEEREKDLDKREKLLNEREKLCQQKLSRTEILMNELHSQRRDQKVDLLKDRRNILDNEYRLYDKENINKYSDISQKPYLTKLSTDLGEELTRALTRAGIKTQVTGLPSHASYEPRRGSHKPIIREARKMSGFR